MKHWKPMSLLLGATMLMVGCHTDMWQQPKLAPLDESAFHTNGMSSRPLPSGTVARGHLREDDAFFTGRENGKYVESFPIKVTKAVILRGQDRFNIYCTPCHGRLGDGNGMISKRGFAVKRPPASYHTDRLRKMPIGHFYDVITNGYGAMFSYASRIQDTKDRWAIVAYVRVLQKSQNATLNDVPAEEQKKMMEKESAKPSGEKSSNTPMGEGH